MTEPHTGPWVESPWQAGTLVTKEVNGERYFGQVVPIGPFGIAYLDGGRDTSVATQTEAIRQGWQPWVAVGQAEPDLIVPASVVSKVANAALALRDQKSTMERTIERQRHEVTSANQELRDFKRALVREIRESVEHEDEDDQEAAYSLLKRLGLDVRQSRRVKVTLSLTVEMGPGESMDESDVTAAIKDDDFDLLDYDTVETEWVVDF